METPQGGVHGESAGAGSPADATVSPPLSPASAALLNARWNPTKEQVAVLEGLYENGVRTPSAEQIQHIAARLREHGPIEAKNVFYWFQNHKARDRQKQKQESFAYFTRLLRQTPPLPPLPVIIRPPGPLYPHLGRVPASPPVLTMAPPAAAACNNGGDVGGTHVMYRAPYYMPPPPPPPEASAANAGYYNLQQAHHRAVMYPRMDITQDKQMHQAGMYHATPYGPSHVAPAKRGGADGGASADQHAGRSRETLELFPLRPTFVLPDNKARGAASLTSPAQLTASASFSGGESESLVDSPKSDAVAPLPFYDFFGLQSAGR